MQSEVISILCNGDFPGRNIARKYLTIKDLEKLYSLQNEEAAVGAATSSRD